MTQCFLCVIVCVIEICRWSLTCSITNHSFFSLKTARRVQQCDRSVESPSRRKRSLTSLLPRLLRGEEQGWTQELWGWGWGPTTLDRAMAVQNENASCGNGGAKRGLMDPAAAGVDLGQKRMVYNAAMETE